MASTYVNNLRLNEMATGDGAGTWGTTTNTNLELIGEALGYGTEAITTNADTHTSTVADGSTDAARAMYIKYTGTLDSACTITIGPNTMKRVQFIENATSGSQNIIISQGSGANITIPPGDVKVVYLDGAGSGAAVVDAFASLSVVDLKVQDDLTVTDDLIVNGDIDLEGNMDVNGSLETDALSLNGTTVTSTAAELNILDGVTSTAAEINLLDGSSANTVVNSKAVIYGSSGQVAGTLSTAAQTNITSVGALNGGSITSGFGSIDVGSSAITTTGTVTGNTLAGTLSTAAQPNITSLGTLSSLVVDDITINGSNITDSGDIYIDVGGDIHLNADGGDIKLEDDTIEFGRISNSASSLQIYAPVQDKDINFLGNDGGSTITALTLDMSAAGAATFNSTVSVAGVGVIGATDGDLNIYSTTANHGGLRLGNGYVGPTNNAGTITNDAISLGLSGQRFTNLYLSDSIQNSGKAGSGTVFNEDGTTADFRVESDGNTHMFFVDGGTNKIAIGHTVPDSELHVIANGNDAQMPLIIGNEDHTDNSTSQSVAMGFGLARDSGTVKNNAGLIKVGKTAAWTGDDSQVDSYMSLSIYKDNAVIEHLKIEPTQIVVNETGADADFRVESDGNANMLFIDGGNNRVGIGTGAPQEQFSVQDGSGGIVFLGRTSGSTTGLLGRIEMGNTDIDSAMGGIDFTQDGATNSSRIGFFTQPAGAAATERLRISSSGNVGIGLTSNADEKLHIKDGALKIEHDTHPVIYLVDVGNSTSQIGVSGSGAGTDGVYIAGYAAVAAGTYDFKITGSNGSIQTRSTIYPATGIQLGSSASSNLLDDYEEGNWTGTLTGGTSAPSTAITTTGYYTKIGNMVTLWIEFNNANVTGASGTVKITGQPFNPASAKSAVGGGFMGRAESDIIGSYMTSTSGGILFVDYLGNGANYATTGAGTYVQATITFAVS